MVRISEPYKKEFLYSRSDKILPIVYQWAVNHNFVFAKKADIPEDGPAMTHTVLDNRAVSFGVLAFPDSQLDNFNKVYADSIEAHELVYLSECVTSKTTPRRLYMDFDMHFEGDLSNVDELGLFSDLFDAVFNIVAAYVDEKDAAMYVLSAGMTLQKKDNNNAVSSRLGLHIVWPRIITDYTKALAFRRALVIGLAPRFTCPSDDAEASVYQACALIGGHATTDTWQSIIDEVVLTNQNLRMPYSRKVAVSKAPLSKEKGENKWCACGGTNCKPRILDGSRDGCRCFKGVCDVNRAYEPFVCRDFSAGSAVTSPIDKIAVHTIVRETSIRVKSDTPLTACRITDNEFVEVYTTEVSGESGSVANGTERKVTVGTVSDDARRVITQYVHMYWRNFMPRNGKDVRISRRGSTYLVMVDGSRCVNAHGGHHTNNPTYLVISQQGRVEQRCMSKKQTLRRFVRCDGVKPHCVHTICKYMCDILFPKRTRGTNNKSVGK